MAIVTRCLVSLPLWLRNPWSSTAVGVGGGGVGGGGVGGGVVSGGDVGADVGVCVVGDGVGGDGVGVGVGGCMGLCRRLFRRR